MAVSAQRSLHVRDGWVVAPGPASIGVGTVIEPACTPRFHPSDFRTSTRDGVGADRPIAYEDLKRY